MYERKANVRYLHICNDLTHRSSVARYSSTKCGREVCSGRWTQVKMSPETRRPFGEYLHFIWEAPRALISKDSREERAQVALYFGKLNMVIASWRRGVLDIWPNRTWESVGKLYSYLRWRATATSAINTSCYRPSNSTCARCVISSIQLDSENYESATCFPEWVGNNLMLT